MAAEDEQMISEHEPAAVPVPEQPVWKIAAVFFEQGALRFDHLYNFK